MEIKQPIDRPEIRARIAAALDVSQQAITNWKTRGFPIAHCLAIERITDGEVTRKDLRPNDFWKIWPDLPAPKTRKAKRAIPTEQPAQA